MQPNKTCKETGCSSLRYHMLGMARPVSRCKEHYLAYKSEYDRCYRERNAERKKAQAKAWHQSDYRKNPDKYRSIRSKRMKDHVEYCRQESYRKYKKQYDLESRWGEYAECWTMVGEILQIVLTYYPTKYERLKARGYYYRKYGFAEPIERNFYTQNPPISN